MRITCYIFALALLGWFGQLVGQPLLEIQQATKFINTDKLQQIYAVTPENEVLKYAPNGTVQYRFSNNTLGNLAFLDATDPLNLLLFYPDYQMLLTLDRTLNKTGELSLLRIGAVQVNAAGIANDGHIWLYDEADFRLRKVDRTGKTLTESQPLNLLLPKAPKPSQLIARDNWVYLFDSTMGILVFSNFGQFDRLIPLSGTHEWQIVEDWLFFRRQNEFLAYNLRSFQQRTLSLPNGTTSEDQLQVQKNRLFVRKSDRILAYAWLW